MNIGTVIALIKSLAPKVDTEVIEQAVSDWLDEHPEVTVADGSITEAKLAEDVLNQLAEINTVKSDLTSKVSVFSDGETGNILIIKDKKDDAPIDSFTLEYYPLRDGTGNAAPNNIRPFIDRWCLDVQHSGEDTSNPHIYHVVFPAGGKNLYNEYSYPLTQGKYIAYANGQAGSSASYAATIDFIPCEAIAGKTVTLNKRPGGDTVGLAFYTGANSSYYLSGVSNGNAQAGNPWTFDVPSNAKYMRFSVPANATNIQIEEGQSSTSYEPFISRGMGGTLNLKTGELVATWVKETANERNWTVTSSDNAYQFGHPECKWDATDNIDCQICSHWENRQYLNEYGAIINGNGALYIGKYVWQAIGITPTAQNIADYFAEQKAAGTPLYVCAKLKEPVTIQLSPETIEQIAGTNVITGDKNTTFTVTYEADAKEYIDKKPFGQKRILVFGDSIWGADRTDGIADYLKEYSGATIFNAAISGTLMCGDREGSADYKPFDGANLIHAKVTNVFTEQDAHKYNVVNYVATGTLPMLKAVDLQTIDIVILAYGTNDFESSRTASATASAFLTAISELLAVNPKMEIICILPPWRMFSSNTVDGDTYENSNNETQLEFSDAVCAAISDKHIQTMNMSRELPWRAETKYLYMDNDAVHPNKNGNQIYAHRVHGKLKSMY